MLPVIKYALPLYQPEGPANAHLILNPPYTLIDTGPNNPEACRILTEDLQSRGIVDKLERIILTHAHPDHAGLVSTLSKMTGAQIWVHELDINNAQDGYWVRAVGLLNKFGLPKDVYIQLTDEIEKRIRRYEALSGNTLNLLQDGGKIAFQDFDLNVIHLPGHTPGSIGLIHEASYTLFSGDTLLPEITPNALIEADSRGHYIPMARTYLDSLQKLAARKIENIYPGHGQPFTNCNFVVRKTIKSYHTRMAQLYHFLSSDWQSPYRIAQKMYPSAEGFELYLAISKIIGLADILAANGKAEVFERDGEILIQKKPPA